MANTPVSNRMGYLDETASPRISGPHNQLPLPSAPPLPAAHLVPDEPIGLPQASQDQQEQGGPRLPEFHFGASSSRPGGALPEAVGGAEGVAGVAEGLLGAL